MELTINHEIRFFKQLPTTVMDLVRTAVSGNTNGIAIALNNRVIPKNAWPETLLKDKDTILIITASQGG